MPVKVPSMMRPQMVFEGGGGGGLQRRERWRRERPSVSGQDDPLAVGGGGGGTRYRLMPPHERVALVAAGSAAVVPARIGRHRATERSWCRPFGGTVPPMRPLNWKSRPAVAPRGQYLAVIVRDLGKPGEWSLG